MKTAKKALSLLLSLIMCFSLITTVFALQETEKQNLVIFVEGIASRDICSAETGDTLFPPSASAIASAVVKAVPGVTQAIINQDTDVLEEPVVNAVNGLFAPIACDEHGVPYSSTVFDYEWPTDEEILEDAKSDDPHDRIIYCYDWRLSMQTIAEGLHSFIEHVLEVTGEKDVALIGFSMGTCAVMSYLKMYDYQYVNTVVLLAGAYIGASCCGEPFSGQIELDSAALVRFVDCSIDTDESLLNVFLASLVHSLYVTGVMDEAVDLGNLLIERLNDAVYDGVFATTFGTMPGLWSLVPAEDYEAAKAILASDLSPEFIEMIDWYHTEVQSQAEQIIQGCIDRGIKFGIIAKYGYAVTPVISDINSMSDTVIDTKYESFGATCADVGKTLGDNYVQKVQNGHDCISADNMIDSSTCKFCDYTWFVKNISHSNEYGVMMDICRTIVNADEQITVWDSEYPQFNIFDGEKAVPLTKENNEVIYAENPSEENTWTVFVKFITDWISHIKYMFEEFRANLKAMGNKFTSFGDKIKEAITPVC